MTKVNNIRLLIFKALPPAMREWYQYNMQYGNIAIINKTIKRILTGRLSDRMYIYIEYLFSKKRLPNLENPTRFSEKIQWLKLHGNFEQYAKYVDKLEVRKIITRKLGKKYLIPLIGFWSKFEDIPFEDLPQKFILKATHGSGYVYFCKDKLSLNKKFLKKLTAKWLDENFYELHREPQYKRLKPRLICENYLKDESGELRDYKFSCFNGVPRMIEVMSNRYANMTIDAFDANWRKLPIKFINNKNSVKAIARPKRLEEMISIAKKLSKNFIFVRVDLYSVNDKIYFGELTFTPGNGIYIPISDQTDYEIGKLLDLSTYRIFYEK
jgi:hypothetical protein